MRVKSPLSIVRRWYGLAALCLAGTLACDPLAFITNNSAWLGGDNPGERGTIKITFVNNTAFFAVFTYGVFDPLNKNLKPQYSQFFADADHTNQRLERNSTSNPVTFTTARAISLGSKAFLDALSERGVVLADPLPQGISFYDKLTTDSDAKKVTIDDFSHQVLYNGVDFDTDTLVTITFEPDDTQTGGIRVDFKTEPLTSN